MKNKRFASAIIFAILAMACLITLIVLDAPLTAGRPITLSSASGEQISGTFYPGRSTAGILILSGFGSDQVMMKPVTLEFIKAGINVMTLDFPGQGLSNNALTFDNASTDRLSRITQEALADFQKISGIQPERMVIFGHSLGARVALQTAVMGPTRPAGLILFGAQVNLGSNAQSEFFTGTSDSALEWVKALTPQTPNLPIYLLTGDLDDILTVEGAGKLMAALCGKEIHPDEGCRNPIRQWSVHKGLLHNFEVYSANAINQAKTWAASIWGESSRGLLEPSSAYLRVLGWFGFLIGLFGFLVRLLNELKKSSDLIPDTSSITVTHARRFLLGKLALWLAAIPLALILMVLYMLIPLYNPVFNLIYGGFIGGYGILMWILYRTRKAPGTSGKLLTSTPHSPVSPYHLGVGILFNLVLIIGVTLFYQSGHGQVPPSGERLIWMVIFTPLTALGFWIGLKENQALAAAYPRRPGLVNWAVIIGLTPFFLRVLLMLVLGSTSGVVGAVTGLAVLALILLQGEITRLITRSDWMAVIFQSLTLYWLVLAAGPLFFRPF